MSDTERFQKAVTLSDALNTAACQWAADNRASMGEVMTGIAVWVFAYCAAAADGNHERCKELLDAIYKAEQHLLPLAPREAPDGG